MGAFLRLVLILAGLSLVACDSREPTFDDVSISGDDGNTGNGGGSPASEVDNGSYKTVTDNASVTQSSGSADILFVIDNSGSMKYEQENMADRFENMLDHLEGIDWQVAITTTDVSRNGFFGRSSDAGELLEFDDDLHILSSGMDKATAENLFGQTIQRSETGSSSEQGMKAVIKSIDLIDDEQENADFFRDASHLAVVIISDEDEARSSTDAEDVIEEVEDELGEEKSFTGHSIITKPGDFGCLDANGREFGDKYAELSMMTGGVIGSVCEADYAKQLSDIGKDVVKRTVPTIDLVCDPIDISGDGVIDILVNEQALNEGEFQIDDGQLSLKKDLDVGDYQLVYYCESDSNEN